MQSTPARLKLLFSLCAFIFILPGARSSGSSFPKQVDSLITMLSFEKRDTEKVKLLNRIAFDLRQTDFQASYSYGRQAQELSRKCTYEKGEARAFSNIGLAWYYHAELDTAIRYYRISIALAQAAHDSDNLGNAYNNLGIAYKDLSNLPMALEFLNRSLRIRQALHDSTGISQVYLNMGSALNRLGNYPGAVQYYLEAITIQEKRKDNASLARSFNGLGNCYISQKNYGTSITWFMKALEKFRLKQDEIGAATVLLNIGNAYYYMDKYELALTFYQQVMEMRIKTHNRKGIAECYMNMGSCYFRTGENKRAEDNFNKAHDIYQEIGTKTELSYLLQNMAALYSKTGRAGKAKELIKTATDLVNQAGNPREMMGNYQETAEIYAGMNEFKPAYELEHTYIRISDSLFNASTSQTVKQMQAAFDIKSKENEIELLSRQQELQNEKINRQQLFLVFLALIILLFVLLVFLVYRGYQRSRTSNRELREAYRTIGERNKAITDSIDYAKKIQGAILPLERDLERVFPSGFGIFLPKDVVSGDFYWFLEQDDKIYFALADCTGHGVPGAFMSMLGSDKLTHAVRDQKLLMPAGILSYLNLSIKDTLRQNESSTGLKDGMDIALCRFDFNESTLLFSGANRPLYRLRNGELTVVEPTKASIGGFTSDAQVFQEHHVEFLPNDTFYLFTDGIVDQFGGPKGKKFMSKRLKELILEIGTANMREQEKIILSRIQAWKGDKEQVDDILVIGIRV